MTKTKPKQKWQTKRMKHNGQWYQVPVIPMPYTQILRLGRRKNVEFDICRWRNNVYDDDAKICGTVCCIGGSIIVIAGEQGEELIHSLPVDWKNPQEWEAATLILKASSKLPVPSFCPEDYGDDDTYCGELTARARAKLRELAKLERES